MSPSSLGHLGVHNGQLAAMPKKPNAVSSQTDDPNKRVEPLPMVGDLEQTVEKILHCLQLMGRNKVQSHKQNYIHSVFVSALMRYKDDVEFYIDEAEQCLHFRSASRVGYSDMGVNAKRYARFASLYLQ